MITHDSFEQISQNLGHSIPPFELDGAIKRFKSDNGKTPFWCIGKTWEYKGNTYKVIKYGDWRNSSVFTWKNYDIKNQTKQFVKKQREVLEEIVLKEKYETKKKNDNCITTWKPKFKQATKSDTVHPYLKYKNVSSNFIAKIDHNNTLMIPAYDQNGFVGAQLIYHSAQEDEFVKRFTTGIKLKGSFCPIGKIKDAKYIYAAEGFATAATVHEITEIPTICAWNANNLYAAIQTLRLINPSCKIIIAAEKDTKESSKNIGIVKAMFCKNRLSNIIVKIPDFEHFDSNNTDFNDLLHETDSETVKKQLEFSSSDFIEIEFLGHDASKYYYFNSQSAVMTSLSISDHNKLHFLSMANNKYWGDRYKFKNDKEGNVTQHADFEHCVECVFEEQREMGFFDKKNVRGYGSWIDKDRIVVNLGDKIIVNNDFVEKVPDSKFRYVSNSPIAIDWNNPLTDQESSKIVDLFKLLNYKNSGDYIYLTGYVALAQIFNTIDWRFQLWITGSKGSGKTEIMKMMSKLIFDQNVYQSVTSASIRQHLKSNAMPMLIDEAEPNCPETIKRMNGVMELIRQCSSRMDTKSLRGTSGGDAIEYSVNSIFCLASIQPSLPTQADKSRFFEVEMNSNENADHEVWNRIQLMFSEIESFAPRLFSRMIRLIPTIKSNIKTIKSLLIESDVVSDPRQADQISTALASSFALKSSLLLDGHNIKPIIDMMVELDIGDSNYENENATDESDTCFDTILQLESSERGVSIDQIIRSIEANNLLKCNHEYLEFLGMRYIYAKKELFIPSNNHQLKMRLKNTIYYEYSKILKRHPDLSKEGTCRIGSKVSKGIFIGMKPLISVTGED